MQILGGSSLKPLRDITGKTFGRLTAVRYVGKYRWLCSCSCGGKATVITSNLSKGNSTSCGCAGREKRFKHGMSPTKIYRVWLAMKQRCENPNDAAFANYGGRGIKVCERWHEFSNFIADMGMRPSGYEIDRKDNDGDYAPDNCRWISKRENLNNKRTNRLVTWKKETLPITTWAERVGVHPRTLFNRIDRGWSLDDAMKPEPRKRVRNRAKRGLA